MPTHIYTITDTDVMFYIEKYAQDGRLLDTVWSGASKKRAYTKYFQLTGEHYIDPRYIPVSPTIAA